MTGCCGLFTTANRERVRRQVLVELQMGAYECSIAQGITPLVAASLPPTKLLYQSYPATTICYAVSDQAEQFNLTHR